jgi:hypothetical protein
LPGALLRVLTARAGQPADEDEVLGAGERLVERRVLAGQPDELADLVRLGGDVVAEHRRAAVVRRDQGGEDADDGGLAGAVRAEEAEDGAGGDGQVDAVHRRGGTEALGQAAGDDGVGRARCGGRCHACHCAARS